MTIASNPAHAPHRPSHPTRPDNLHSGGRSDHRADTTARAGRGPALRPGRARRLREALGEHRGPRAQGSPPARPRVRRARHAAAVRDARRAADSGAAGLVTLAERARPRARDGHRRGPLRLAVGPRLSAVVPRGFASAALCRLRRLRRLRRPQRSHRTHRLRSSTSAPLQRRRWARRVGCCQAYRCRR